MTLDTGGRISMIHLSKSVLMLTGAYPKTQMSNRFHNDTCILTLQ